MAVVSIFVFAITFRLQRHQTERGNYFSRERNGKNTQLTDSSLSLSLSRSFALSDSTRRACTASPRQRREDRMSCCCCYGLNDGQQRALPFPLSLSFSLPLFIRFVGDMHPLVKICTYGYCYWHRRSLRPLPLLLLLTAAAFSGPPSPSPQGQALWADCRSVGGLLPFPLPSLARGHGPPSPPPLSLPHQTWRCAIYFLIFSKMIVFADVISGRTVV